MSPIDILFYAVAIGSAMNTVAVATGTLPARPTFVLRKTLCAIYTAIIVYLLLTTPTTLFGMFTLKSFQEMFENPLVVIGSIIHFSVGNIRVLQGVLKTKALHPIVHVALIGLCFAWAPIAELFTFCIFAAHIVYTRTMYAKVANKLFVGNHDSLFSLRKAMKGYELGVDSTLSQVTAALNVGAVPFDSQQDPIPQTRYMRLNLPGGEPLDPDFPNFAAKYTNAIDIISRAIQNTHTVLVVCDSGRKQSAVLAAMYLIGTGEPVDAVIERVEYAYMTPNEKSEYARIYQLRESNKYTDKFELEMRDNRIFSKLTEEKICLSPQLKKMLRYYAQNVKQKQAQ